MKTNVIPFSEFKDRMRNVVLAALDAEVREVLQHEKADGWTDHELPALFGGVDAHIQAVAMRINAGHEPGSAGLRIDLEA